MCVIEVDSKLHSNVIRALTVQHIEVKPPKVSQNVNSCMYINKVNIPITNLLTVINYVKRKYK